MDDRASNELEQIRKQIIKCEEKMKLKAEQILRSQKDCMADNYCTFRNGRICHPLMDKVTAVSLQFEVGKGIRGMLKVAIRAAYGEEAVESYVLQNPESKIAKKNTTKITKAKSPKKNMELHSKYRIGDSVMVYPEKKIGIVCEPINEKGVLRVRLQKKYGSRYICSYVKPIQLML